MDELPASQPATPDEVEIHAQGSDVDDIMATIRHNVQMRRAQGLYEPSRFTEFEDVACPQEPAHGEYNPLLYFHLRQVNRSYSQFQLELDIRPSGLERVPVVGSLWNTLRRHLHTLSIVYVNKIAGPLIAFNRHMVTILNLLIRQDQKREAELEQLRLHIAELEARLASQEEQG